MKTLTLQGKIFVLLSVFTIITLVVFVAVQFWHELKIINKYKETEAQIVTLTVENIWEKVSNLSIDPQTKAMMLQKKFSALKQAGAIRGAYILDRSGNIVVTTGVGYGTPARQADDLKILEKLEEQESIKGEVSIDAPRQEFSFYIPLEAANSDERLVVRLFFSLGDLAAAFRNILTPAVFIGIGIALVNVILGAILSRMVVGPIQFFNEVAAKIASGRLDLRIQVKTDDEIEELADTFNFMTAELYKMQERAVNANPLTKLPGNIVIREEVEKRIAEGKKFTVIYCDLDNFKAFNDKYGIHKGDEAIMLSGEIFKDATKKFGNPDDFVGHEGGDDFILLSTPDKAQALAGYISSEFDKGIRSLYDQGDLERGHIVAHDREGAVKTFPIMTISLAGVTNQHRLITTYAEVTNIAAEVKKKAKSMQQSCFVLDSRKK